MCYMRTPNSFSRGLRHASSLGVSIWTVVASAKQQYVARRSVVTNFLRHLAGLDASYDVVGGNHDLEVSKS